eukprot:6030155-Heterocapsa_arctica.AAC.1
MRDRLYWCDSDWIAETGEQVREHRLFTEVKLRNNPKRRYRLHILDGLARTCLLYTSPSPRDA